MTSIIARYQNYQVEILDRWTSGGQEFATVKALDGSPFVGGDKWPVHTPFANIRIDELEAAPQADTDQRPNLLNMALEYQGRRQWHNGESVTLIADKAGRPKVFLKNHGGEVRLCVAGYQPSCLVYLLTENGWELNRYVGLDYRTWANKAEKAVSNGHK